MVAGSHFIYVVVVHITLSPKAIMKTLFIEAKKKELECSYDFSALSEKVCLLHTIQFRPFAGDLKRELEKQGKRVFFGKGHKAGYPGQVLGCDAGAAILYIDKADCFLLAGSGKWHAERIALSLPKPKPFFILTSRGVEKVDYAKLKKSRQALLARFHFAEKIGIIASTKPGQQNLDASLNLKEKLEKKGKKVFIFVSDMINPAEFENFKVDFWINTACPGLAFDSKSMLNIDELNLNIL